MQASDIPAKIPEPFAKNAVVNTYKRAIPQTTTTPGAASWDLGFPPETFNDPNAGGFPPNGMDANGVLNAISAWSQWVQAGGAPIAYDSTFQTTVGGYPNGAIVASLIFPGTWWRSTADNNTTNPDTGGANWVSATALSGGQCLLNPVSATQITLVPRDGANIVINGATVQVPLAGVTANNTGVMVNGVAGQNLAASTVYYVSVFWNGTALQLAYWQQGVTYSRTTDSSARNLGVQVISATGVAQSAHSLVGLVATNASAQFDNVRGQSVISWFNRATLPLLASQATVSFTNTVEGEISTAFRCTFLTWLNDGVLASCDGVRTNSLSGANGSDLLQLAVDGAIIGSLGGGYVSATPAQQGNFESSFNGVLADGLHYATLYGAVTGGTTGVISQGYTRVNVRG